MAFLEFGQIIRLLCQDQISISLRPMGIRHAMTSATLKVRRLDLSLGLGNAFGKSGLKRPVNSAAIAQEDFLADLQINEKVALTKRSNT